MKLSKRLACCAELVPAGARVADVGCDHGYLSILLAQRGHAVQACDLREKPLHKAQRNAALCGVAEKIRFCLADGLDAVAPESVDAVICAGMGGDLIAQILARAPWLRDARYTLIFQPQSSGNDLRRALGAMGFGTRRELLVRDGGFLYNVLLVRFGGAVPLTPGQEYCPPLLLQDPLLLPYLERLERSLALTVAGIERAQTPSDRLPYYTAACNEIRALLEKERANADRT